MKTIITVTICVGLLVAGCMSEVEKQARINQLNLDLEVERQRLDIPEEIWQQYVDNFKQNKCGGWEYQWGKNWRYWAMKDAAKFFTPYLQRQLLVEQFKAAYPDNWQQKLLEYDLQQQFIQIQQQAIRQEQARQDWRQRSIGSRQWWDSLPGGWENEQYQRYWQQQNTLNSILSEIEEQNRLNRLNDPVFQPKYHNPLKKYEYNP